MIMPLGWELIIKVEFEKIEGFSRIYQVNCFEKEFVKATSEKGSNGRYHKWLRRSLFILDDMGKKALNTESFEKLSVDSVDLYAIRYPHSKKNPRVIYVYAEENAIYILHAFKESRSKDYDASTKIAKNRAKFI